MLTTAGSEDEARKIAAALVERRLAACVNVVAGVQSVYRWQGKVESAGEWLLLIKTTAARTGALQRAIAKLHSYELPEFVVLEIIGGSERYLSWVTESVVQE